MLDMLMFADDSDVAVCSKADPLKIRTMLCKVKNEKYSVMINNH